MVKGCRWGAIYVLSRVEELVPGFVVQDKLVPCWVSADLEWVWDKVISIGLGTHVSPKKTG